jgi:uncharacterized phage infection (PIP) family protein YhgE
VTDAESLLRVAAELEARDARVAAELARVEEEQRAVDEERARAAELAELLAWLPQAISENDYSLHEAVSRRDEAAAALRAAEADIARLDEHRAAFARQTEEASDAVAALAGTLHTAGLEDTLEKLSQRRGALLVEHSNLARERDAVVREASELLASVLGDPLTSTSVAGLRERLRRALP